MFTEYKAYLSTSIELARYISSAYGSWNNFDSDKSNNNNVICRVKNNDDDKNIGGEPSNNLYKLYSIYD